jgi:hypothetical protein
MKILCVEIKAGQRRAIPKLPYAIPDILRCQRHRENNLPLKIDSMQTCKGPLSYRSNKNSVILIPETKIPPAEFYVNKWYDTHKGIQTMRKFSFTLNFLSNKLQSSQQKTTTSLSNFNNLPKDYALPIKKSTI